MNTFQTKAEKQTLSATLVQRFLAKGGQVTLVKTGKKAIKSFPSDRNPNRPVVYNQPKR
jgi:hypothetical protein